MGYTFGMTKKEKIIFAVVSFVLAVSLIMAYIVGISRNALLSVHGAKVATCHATEPDSEANYYRLSQDATLFADAELSAPIFDMPATYFVQVFGESDNYYLVMYGNFWGYAKKENLKKVSYVPKNAYIKGVTVRAKNNLSLAIKETPDAGAATKLILSPSYTICYVASMTINGTTWYYILAELASSLVICGYLPSTAVELSHALETNTETEPTKEASSTVTDTETSLEPDKELIEPAITTPTKVMILIIFSLPALALLLLLVIKPKQYKEEKDEKTIIFDKNFEEFDKKPDKKARELAVSQPVDTYFSAREPLEPENMNNLAPEAPQKPENSYPASKKMDEIFINNYSAPQKRPSFFDFFTKKHSK